jgi:N-acetylglucosaminyl-diphospho-decaprenol L-rhamnosyltransferase
VTVRYAGDLHLVAELDQPFGEDPELDLGAAEQRHHVDHEEDLARAGGIHGGSIEGEPRGLGVVVLSYGSSGVYRELLDSLWAEGVAKEDVLVVHNPAQAGEPDPELPAGCELLRTGRNLGYAGGMNRGVERISERGVELVLLLTHDARLRPGALGAMLEAAELAPGHGVLGPALVLADSGEPFSFGGVTRANGTTFHRKEAPGVGVDRIAACDWVDGGTMLVRRGAIERAGRFDERFWGYCEESDFCLRVSRAGFAVGVAVDAVAEQDPGGPKRPGAWAYLLTRNGAEYARRAAGWRGAATVEARAVWSVGLHLARSASRLVRRRPGGPGATWAVAVGTLRGALDFLRGRWGPPPANLPGMGDVGNA